MTHEGRKGEDTERKVLSEYSLDKDPIRRGPRTEGFPWDTDVGVGGHERTRRDSE